MVSYRFGIYAATWPWNLRLTSRFQRSCTVRLYLLSGADIALGDGATVAGILNFCRPPVIPRDHAMNLDAQDFTWKVDGGNVLAWNKRSLV